SCRSAPASRSSASACARPPGLSSMLAAHTSTCSTYSTRGSITVLLPPNCCALSAICNDTNAQSSLRLILHCGSSDVAMKIACHYVADILWLWRKPFHDKNQEPTL